jgi:hypothetical protein
MPPVLDDPHENRIKMARAGLMKKLAAVWRGAREVSVEYELVARSGGPLGGGPQSTTEADSAATIAAWAVDTANEFLIDTGAAGQTGFILRFGSVSFQFYLTPENDASLGSRDRQLEQALAHNEALASLYIETTSSTIKSLSTALASKDAALMSKDATINAMMDRQLEVVRAYAQIMDTKYQRDIEMKGAERREARYDLAAGQVMNLLGGVASVAGPKIIEKIEERMSPNVLDKLASLLTPEEKALLGKLLQNAQARAAGDQNGVTPGMPIETTMSPSRGQSS